VGQALKLRHALIALFHMRWMGVESELTQQDRADYQRLCLPESPEFMLHIFPGDMHRIPFASASFSFVYSYNAIFFITKSDIARSMDEIERVLKPGGVLCEL